MKTIIFVVIALLVVSISTVGSVHAKGLKVNLAIDSNQQSQNAGATTWQFGRIIADATYIFVNQGRTDTSLQYENDQVQNGNFMVCIRLNNGVESCGNGYNSEAKRPESVFVSLSGNSFSETVQQNNGPSQSQSQSSNNENNNNNALSQSQNTNIYICNEGKCVPQ